MGWRMSCEQAVVAVGIVAGAGCCHIRVCVIRLSAYLLDTIFHLIKTVKNARKAK